jgi:6-pyruvoyltetrahydropterin/6-carboxytetrahydropterin synthase
MTQLVAEEGYTFRSSKTYNHSVGLSCCFRQWRATSHCRYLHGYALKVHLEFEGELDQNNWVVDFGGLKHVKAWLEEMFDHKTMVAEDDPELERFQELDAQRLIQISVVPSVGVEAFSHLIFSYVKTYTSMNSKMQDRIQLVRVTVSEHDGNGASYGRA